MGKSKATADDAPQLVEALLRAWPSALPAGGSVRLLPEARPLFASAGAVRTAIIVALLPEISRTWAQKVAAERAEEAKPLRKRNYRDYDSVVARVNGLHKLLGDLLRATADFSTDDQDALFGWVADQDETHLLYVDRGRLVKCAQEFADHQVLGARTRAGLQVIKTSLARTPTAANLRLMDAIDVMLAPPGKRRPTRLLSR